MEILNFSFKPDNDKNVSKQLRDYIIEAIETNKYKEGDTLPSIRKLSENLGVSKSVVENAYNYLRNHYYIKPHDRSGYTILKQSVQNNPATVNYLDDLNSYSDYSLNEKLEYSSMLNRIYKQIAQNALYEDNSTDGFIESYKNLQNHISNLLFFFNGFKPNPSNIILFGNYIELFNYLKLKIKNIYIGLEKDITNEIEQILKYMDIKYSFAKELCNSPNANLLFIPFNITSKSYTTSYDLDSILKWAHDDRYVLETNFNSKIIYEHEPQNILFDKIKDNYIFADNFSEVLGPKYRLTFVVLPDKLLPNSIYSYIDYPTLKFYETLLEKDYYSKYYFTIKRKAQQKLNAVIYELECRNIDYIKPDAGFYITVNTENTSKIIEKTSSYNIDIIQLEAPNSIAICFSDINLKTFPKIAKELFD